MIQFTEMLSSVRWEIKKKSTGCYRLLLDDLAVKSTFNNMEQNYILYQK
jgi:hypothetical protein